MFGRGGFDGHRPGLEEGDEYRLSQRLMYLLMLIRRGDAGMRHGGERRAGGFQGQGRVLRLLSLRSPVAQKELAYLLGIRSQSLAELVTKLEKAGLVTRHPDPKDRRTSVVELTDAGRAAVEESAEEPDSDPFSVLAEPDKQKLAELLDQVIQGMESRLPGGPDPRMQMFKQMAFDGGTPGPGFGGGFGPGGFGGFGGGFGPGGRDRGDR